jgi:hypothetical protein
MATSYRSACRSLNPAATRSQVCAEKGELRHCLVFTVWIRSTNGRWGERGPERGVGKVHNNSAHRSSISHPTLALGAAARNAETAGRPWIISPMAPSRTINRRSDRGGWLCGAGTSGRVVAAGGTFTNAAVSRGNESVRSWNGPWHHPQFPLARRTRLLRPAPGHFRRYSRCPWRECQGEFPG